MTTIAYREGVLCADTSVHDRDTYVGAMDKIVKRKSDGKLAGAAGAMEDVVAFLDWFMRGSRGSLSVSKTGNFEGLVVHGKGEVEWFGANGRSKPILLADFPFTAIGSGFKVAMGAMAHGASAQDAIKIACQLDVYTREPITTLRYGKTHNAKTSSRR